MQQYHGDNFKQQWRIPSVDLTLGDHETHIWRAVLNESRLSSLPYEHLLSEEEVTRARRFRFERDRQHFIQAHGVLRCLLAHYLHTEPRQLRFQYNAYGKPSLALPSRESTLHFNLSHSHELALYAFTYNRHIGIDIEYMRSDISYGELARHSFSAHEHASFTALPLSLQRQAFFNCWTRKEAYIKARGLGLSLPLHLFDVSLQPGERAVLLASREDPRETARWSFHELLPQPDYAAAVVVEGEETAVQQWQWDESGFFL